VNQILPADPAHWPKGKYRILLLDPPWKYYGDPDKAQAAGKHYPCMTYEQICRLPILALLQKPAVVFCWATGPMLHVALNAIRAWGLNYRGVAYVWVKTTKAGKVISGQGVRPTITKPTTEFVLAATTCSKGRPLPLLTEAQGQVVFGPDDEQEGEPLFAPRPGNRHSAKPDEVRQRIEALYGDVPRVEMFARDLRPGWDGWGDELG
jgi:N6-adenosine-specific RNA methylase IME4